MRSATHAPQKSEKLSSPSYFLVTEFSTVQTSEEQEYEGADISEGGLEAYPAFSKIS